MPERLIFPMKDKNGNEIYENDTVLVDGQVCIAMYVEKDSEWVFHPCNKNVEPSNIKHLR